MKTTKIGPGHYTAEGGRYDIKSHYNTTGTTWSVVDTQGQTPEETAGSFYDPRGRGRMTNRVIEDSKRECVYRIEGAIARERASMESR